MKTQALVIGAGPAGCAAALTLRRAGVEVILADRSDFPRDKVCGDALIPDSLAALERLGLKDSAAAAGRQCHTLHIHAPDGTRVALQSEFVCLPRRSFDSLLQQAAVSAGAIFLPLSRALGPLMNGNAVAGARFRPAGGGSDLEVRAEMTLLATGASPAALADFGVCLRRRASALAVRAYYRVPDDLAQEMDHLCISYGRAVRPGYGWIFPGPDNVFNVGVGVFQDGGRRPPAANPRLLWPAFTRGFLPARRIVEEGERIGPLQGAPLRTGLSGARLHRPGLLVIGEAAGLTYSFSGEGIGKAMESGILAGEILVRHFAGTAGDPAEAGPQYENTLRARYGERFRAYRIAQDWLYWPSVCNLVARRANSDQRVRRLLEGMLSETTEPRAILSVAGLLTLLK